MRFIDSFIGNSIDLSYYYLYLLKIFFFIFFDNKQHSLFYVNKQKSEKNI